MNRKFLLSVFAYVVPSMLIAVPWHLHFFKQAYHDFGIYTREDPIIALGMVAMLLQGGVMAWLYPRTLAAQPSTLQSGVRFGLLFGLFLFSVSTIANIAKIDVHAPWHFVWLSGVFHLMQFAAAGALMGWIHRPRSA